MASSSSSSSSSTAPPPWPQSGKYIATVRESCAELRKASHVEIDRPAIEAWLRDLDRGRFDDLKRHHGLGRMPLKFENFGEEVNFLASLSLLNFLSAYRAPLHRYTGQGSYQSVLRLTMSLFISSASHDVAPLSAKGMAETRADTLASVLGVPLHVEEKHPTIPGLSVAKPRQGDGWEVVELLRTSLVETGEALLRLGKRDLGELVIEALAQRGGGGNDDDDDDASRADRFLEKIVTSIPSFYDAHATQPPVYVFKKAFFLIMALYQRFPPSPKGTHREGGEASSDDARPRTIDPYRAKLPIFCDNVVPTLVFHLGFARLAERHDDDGGGVGGRGVDEGVRRFCDDVDRRRAVAAGGEGGGSGGEDASLRDVEEGVRVGKESAYRLRASALDVGAEVCRVARELAAREPSTLGWLSDMNEVDLDGYLWSVAKADRRLRAVPRLVERGTQFH